MPVLGGHIDSDGDARQVPIHYIFVNYDNGFPVL